MQPGLFKRIQSALSAWLSSSEASPAAKQEALALLEWTRWLADAEAIVSGGAPDSLSYDQCRTAYELLHRVLAGVHETKQFTAFEIGLRRHAAGVPSDAQRKSPFVARYLRYLSAEDPLAEIRRDAVGILEALSAAMEVRTDAAERHALAAEILEREPAASVRLLGLRQVDAWLDKQLEPDDRHGSGLLKAERELRQVARRAAFLPAATRNAWTAAWNVAHRAYLEQVDGLTQLNARAAFARRCRRLDDAIDALIAWAPAWNLRAPPTKSPRAGHSKKLAERLEASRQRIAQVTPTPGLVDTLDDWLTTSVTQLKVGLPIIIAMLSVAFAAEKLDSTYAVFSAGWGFFDVANPERLAALVLIVMVIVAFFWAQLHFVRTRARMLGVTATLALLVAAIVLPIAGARLVRGLLTVTIPATHASAPADDGRCPSPAADPAATPSILPGVTPGRGYECHAGFHSESRTPSLLVLRCDGKNCPTLDQRIVVPTDRIDAMIESTCGTCLRFRSAEDRIPAPPADVHVTTPPIVIPPSTPPAVEIRPTLVDAPSAAALIRAMERLAERAPAATQGATLTLGDDVAAVLARWLPEERDVEASARARTLSCTTQQTQLIEAAGDRLRSCRERADRRRSLTDKLRDIVVRRKLDACDVEYDRRVQNLDGLHPSCVVVHDSPPDDRRANRP